MTRDEKIEQEIADAKGKRNRLRLRYEGAVMVRADHREQTDVLRELLAAGRHLATLEGRIEPPA